MKEKFKMFEDNLNFVNAEQEGAVDLPDTDLGTGAVEDAQSSSEEAATPQPNGNNGQSAEDNRAFAEMRRKNEAYESANGSLIESLRQLGYQGTPEEISRQIRLEQSGMAEEEFRRHEDAFEERINNDPRVIAAQELTRKVRLEKDLQAVKEAYPECKAKSVKELGDVFLNLMRSGNVDPVDAYAAQLAHNKRQESKIPPKIGAVNTTIREENEFFSENEIRNLTSEELDDPKILEKALKSLKKLK